MGVLRTHYIFLLYNSLDYGIRKQFHKGSPETNKTSFIIDTHSLDIHSILILSSHLHLGLSKCLLPVSSPIEISKALLSFSIMALYSLGTTYLVLHYEPFSTSHSHPFWIKIFVSGSCIQIPQPLFLP